MQRTVEVFTGAYASGKSESAINRALQSAKRGEKITLVDFDTVEPAYCLRPIVKVLEKRNINVIAQEDYFGLGEAGSYINVRQISCLKNEGNIIIDVGYGASGLDILDVITDIEQEKDLRIYLVVNTSKFETKDEESILEYIDFASGLNKKEWKKFKGFVSNTHFGSETKAQDIIRGYEILKNVSEKTRIPIIALGADESLIDELGQTHDGVPIWYYERFMPQALW